MLQHILTEIKQTLEAVNISDYHINEKELQRLHDCLRDHAMDPEKYISYFISYGLLLLHLETHHQLENNLDSDCCSDIILKGDLFYSLYYEYAARHTFSLIRHNVARVLEMIEIESIHTDNLSHDLSTVLVNIIKQEDFADELFM